MEIQFPEPLDTPDFKVAWLSHEQYLREIKRRSLPPSSVKAKLAEMAEWGKEAAIEAIRQTISNGWQGIFKPKSLPSKPRAEGAPEAKEGSARPRTIWQIKQVMEVVEDRLQVLRRHRGEVTMGQVIWDSESAKKEHKEKRDQLKQLKKELLLASC